MWQLAALRDPRRASSYATPVKDSTSVRPRHRQAGRAWYVMDTAAARGRVAWGSTEQ